MIESIARGDLTMSLFSKIDMGDVSDLNLEALVCLLKNYPS